ncbi:MAG TPA: hypothetical protein VFT76_01945 [Actinomycetota bacterium]|nr:hypothetical protein [Actinomycetota bacterium]
MTATNRPNYLSEVLASWAAVRGISDALMLFNVEPGNGDVASLAEEWEASPKLVFSNRARYGVLGNPWWALDRAFTIAERAGEGFVVLAEDDSTVADDVLEYFAYAAEVGEENREIFSVNAFNLRACPSECCRRSAHHVHFDPSFYSTVWGTWADRWNDELRKEWDFDYVRGGWDLHIDREILVGGRRSLTPCRSRSQHIGEFGGAHMLEEHFAFNQSDCFDPSPSRDAFWGADDPVDRTWEVPCASP